MRLEIHSFEPTQLIMWTISDLIIDTKKKVNFYFRGLIFSENVNAVFFFCFVD